MLNEVCRTCCFLGHRTIQKSEALKSAVYETIENLILDKSVDRFLFGSKSQFDSLALDVVTTLKKKYPHIKRVYVRAEFPAISDDYQAYLLESYEESYYPDKLLNAGKAVYVERNFEMIDQSQFCVIYYDANQAPTERKSGTKIALDYAVKREKTVILLPKRKIL